MLSRILNFLHLESVPRSGDAATDMAAELHQTWRRNFQGYTVSKHLPRVKKNKDGSPDADINVPLAELNIEWKQENLTAAKVALKAIRLYPNNDEAAAEYIHQQWMIRNPKESWNESQHKPFDDLPKVEQDKDRVHVKLAKKYNSLYPVKS